MTSATGVTLLARENRSPHLSGPLGLIRQHPIAAIVILTAPAAGQSAIICKFQVLTMIAVERTQVSVFTVSFEIYSTLQNRSSLDRMVRSSSASWSMTVSALLGFSFRRAASSSNCSRTRRSSDDTEPLRATEIARCRDVPGATLASTSGEVFDLEVHLGWARWQKLRLSRRHHSAKRRRPS